MPRAHLLRHYNKLPRSEQDAMRQLSYDLRTNRLETARFSRPRWVDWCASSYAEVVYRAGSWVVLADGWVEVSRSRSCLAALLRARTTTGFDAPSPAGEAL